MALATPRLVAIGLALIEQEGRAVVEAAYGTTDPEWVGRYALRYGDANADGTLN